MSATKKAAITGRRRLNGNLITGAVLVSLLVVGTLLSFVWTPYDPIPVDATVRLQPPSADHWLGTDPFGRDIVSLLLYGARVSLLVGFLSVAVAIVIGVPLGMLSGMAGRVTDASVSRVNDVLLAFPPLLLVIVLGASIGASLTTTVLALGIGGAPAFFRVVRGGTMQVMSQEYITAAKASNTSQLTIAIRHVLPNVSALIIVQGSIAFGVAVLAEAALSYLGFGAQPPTPSWGRMLQEGQQYLYSDPLLVLWPGLAIAIAVLGLNLLGDGLRDLLDPRMEVSR